MFDKLLFVSLGLNAISIGLIAFCFVWLKQSRDKYASLQKNLDKVFHSCEKNSLAIDEVRTGAIGMGKTIQQIKASVQVELQNMSDKQAELAMHDPDSKLYNRAAKMVAKGASVEEIMMECEIPRAEAELVIAMRGKVQS
ncbi:DUF2802 domain-containing protein [Saccharobesus litoralis]|nr:DUF2802 domain-containing protein [Saccharobesus litoralis]